ncbi:MULTISPECIES: response regulator transcription factor [Enterococcus]|uniref:response regulator transcription factor n=1 Tax=Enterococcus TaxID=1350 RepID=UPI000825B406|nr:MULTISPECIES: response regulator transcription factor [Enterococcus]NBA61387.1 response regulator [Enterococcus mundtii]SFM19286.1 DNA-binding response regulator, OmpR family, contains REC and winged-helix (wHTH) domain [Enterococcus mundtii]
MRSEKILAIDEDLTFRRMIWKALQPAGVLIYQSDSVEKTLDIMSRVTFDLYLLDIRLAHQTDGYHIVQLIREQDSLSPIVFFTEQQNEIEIITGLEMGADYYITKPFNPTLLKAQVLAILDRHKVLKEQTTNCKKNKIIIGDFCFDKALYRLYKKGRSIELSSKKIKLMQFFIENPEQVFSKEQIYQSVWNDSELDANTIMVFINHLRNKIEDDPKNVQYLRTVRGLGYIFLPSGKESNPSN